MYAFLFTIGGCFGSQDGRQELLRRFDPAHFSDPTLTRALQGSPQRRLSAKYKLGDGLRCLEGYEPLTTSWQDCRTAARTMGFGPEYWDHENFGENDEELPEGCFLATDSKKFYFGPGPGVSAGDDDFVICIPQSAEAKRKREETFNAAYELYAPAPALDLPPADEELDTPIPGITLDKMLRELVEEGKAEAPFAPEATLPEALEEDRPKETQSWWWNLIPTFLHDYLDDRE